MPLKMYISFCCVLSWCGDIIIIVGSMSFIYHNLRDWFSDIGTITRSPQYQWSNAEGFEQEWAWSIQHKQEKAKIICVAHIYCISRHRQKIHMAMSQRKTNQCRLYRCRYINLSHTWVRYPGFWGHEVKYPILTTVVPGFSGDLIGCTIRSKWGPFGDLYLARKILFCVWNKLFLGEINFPKGELVLQSLYGDKLSLCRNQQMNGKI